MSEKSGFSDERVEAASAVRAAEALFDGSLQSDRASDRTLAGLQQIAPDKPLLSPQDVSRLPVEQQLALKSCVASAAAICAKVCEPLRNVYNTAMRNGGGPEEMEKLEKYSASVQKVLSANMAEIAAECPVRVAFPVFVTGHAPSGKMEARVGHAFFPPLRADVCENCIVTPVHFPDKSVEAQARKQGVSFANSISSWELFYQAKVGAGLLPRRESQNV